MKSLKSTPGFTLIELLVVVAIIGILAGLVTVNLASARVRARDAQRVSDLGSVATALELYRTVTKKYPVPSGTNDFQDLTVLTPDLVPAYLSTIPTDPSHQSNHGFGNLNYVYATNKPTLDGKTRSLGSTFSVDAALEAQQTNQPIDSRLQTAATNNSASDFFRTGYYYYPSANGQLHYRVSQ